MNKKRCWLVECRNKLNQTQEEVAEKVGMHAASYAHIENGTRVPSVKAAKKIAEALDFDWTKFFIEEK